MIEKEKLLVVSMVLVNLRNLKKINFYIIENESY